MVDDSWSRLDDGPFPIREAVDVESYNDKPLQFSHLLIPAGTTVRMQRDGNLWSWILQPRPERSRDLQITIYKPDGAMGHTGGKATAFAEGLSLTAVDSTPQVLRMAGLQLELPCLAVDSIRFVNTDYLHPDLTVGSSVMEAKLAARSGGDGARHLPHDTLALGLGRGDGLAADSACARSSPGKPIHLSLAALAMAPRIAGQACGRGYTPPSRRMCAPSSSRYSWQWLVSISSINVDPEHGPIRVPRASPRDRISLHRADGEGV